MAARNKKGDGDPSPLFNHGIASVDAGDRKTAVIYSAA
jgi:hypothetical protein